MAAESKEWIKWCVMRETQCSEYLTRARLYFLARLSPVPARASQVPLSPLLLLQPDWLAEKPGT